MKTKLSKLYQYDVSKRAALIALAALVLLKLLLCCEQRIFITPEISTLDDTLFYTMAKSVRAGEWLGAYSYLAMGKHALFALWLAFINALGVPYLMAGQALYAISCLAAYAALAPVLKNRLHRVLAFALLLFSPASCADFTLRVYRDNITTSVFLLCIVCALGFLLRAKDGSGKALWGFGIVGGLAFGAGILLREDGWWTVVFVVPCAVASLIILIKNKRAKQLAALSMLAVCAALPILAYCAQNARYYGRFAISDLTSSEFSAAYGAMTRVIVPEDEAQSPIVPVPASTLEKLYGVSPSFAKLREYLEAPDFWRWQKDCGNGKLEYSGGGIYWAVRNAADLAGYYETPETAREYFTALANEINAAADSGALGEVLPARSGLNSPITAKTIAPTLSQSLEGLFTVVTYKDMTCEPETSYGPLNVMADTESFTRNRAQYGERTPDGLGRLVYWAVSEDGYVEFELSDEDGGAVGAQTISGTAGDVYLDFLSRGTDLRYSDGARKTLIFTKPDEHLTLTLSDGQDTVSITDPVVGEAVSDGGITYEIEYIGDNYTENVSFGFAELWLYRALKVITYVYKLLSPVLCALAVFLLVRYILLAIKRRSFMSCGLVFLSALLTLFAAAVRIGMVSFADATAFGLGVYTMYLAAVYPLMLLSYILCLCLKTNKN